MKPTLLMKTLIGIALLSGGLIFGLVMFAMQNERHLPPALRISYYQLYVDAFKAIAVGVGVAVFGVLIPTIATETRHRSNTSKRPDLNTVS
jgi:hypothetical protein